MAIFKGKDKEEKERKPFKETGIGKFLAEKAPDILSTVGDLLPDKGGLAIIKNLIKKHPTLSPTDKLEGEELTDNELEVLKINAQDRDSARNREVQLAKVGGTDFMMYVAGLTALGLFVFIVVSIVYMPQLAENKLLIHVLGIIEGICTSIFFYYFGSSKSSADKNKMINKTL